MPTIGITESFLVKEYFMEVKRMGNQTVFYTCLMSVYSTLMLAICCVDWTKTEKRFRIKKIMDAIVPVLTYVLVVYGHYIYILNGSKATLWLAAGLAFKPLRPSVRIKQLALVGVYRYGRGRVAQ